MQLAAVLFLARLDIFALSLRPGGVLSVIRTDGFRFDPAQDVRYKVDYTRKSNDLLFTGEARWDEKRSSLLNL